MTSTKTLTALAAGVIAFSTAGMAAAQTPYGQTQTQPGNQQEAFGAILGALFGNGSSLEGQWMRGQRPLNTGRAQFETRLSADVRSGALNTSSTARLRADYDALVQQESSYSQGGFSTQERADLNQRYMDLTARVDAGVSSRRLTRTAATRLRADYQTLVQTEASYQRDGSISAREQDDLDAQLDALDARIGDVAPGGGYGNGGYQPVADPRTRLSNIDAALSTGERSGQINRTEAADIRVELGDLTRLEAAYARTSPSRDDTDYLARRLGELEVRARVNNRR